MVNERHNGIEEVSVEQKLIALYTLQQIDSQIDKIKIIRGELPLEVQDLEDELAGLETRISNFKQEIEKLNQEIADWENAKKESTSLIKKYEEQRMNVRNNREYDSLTKEIEYQNLEIQLSDKKINESRFKIENLDALLESRAKLAKKIPERDLAIYERVAKRYEYLTVVVPVQDRICLGCFMGLPTSAVRSGPDGDQLLQVLQCARRRHPGRGKLPTTAAHEQDGQGPDRLTE